MVAVDVAAEEVAERTEDVAADVGYPERGVAESLQLGGLRSAASPASP